MDVQNFEEDVVKASHERPVVVDFWAPWCGPCRVLGPIIEKLAAEQPDIWTLVKVNTDEHQELSTRYDIRGIPAVKLFSGGEVIDEFTGSLPESAIRQWLEKALPSRAKELLGKAMSHFDAGAPQLARPLLEEALELEPVNPVAAGLMASILVFDDPVRAVELAETGKTGESSIAQLANSVIEFATLVAEELPDDSENGAQEYGEAIIALRDSRVEDAIPLLIEVLQKNRYLKDDAARRLGVSVFTLLGPHHPVALAFRRTFDMWLY